MSHKNNNLFITHTQSPNKPNNYDSISVDELINASDNSVDEIFVSDILGSFDDSGLNDFFSSCVKKLKNNGLLYIQDLDIEQFSLYLYQKIIPITYKAILYHNRHNIFI